MTGHPLVPPAIAGFVANDLRTSDESAREYEGLRNTHQLGPARFVP